MEGELSEETPLVVVEAGAWICKAGLAGDKTCSVVFPALVGRSRNEGPGPPGYTTGDAVESCTEDQDLIRPIQMGAVTDWDALEQIWGQVFQELRVNSQDIGVLCMDKMCSPKADREKICQMMFEKFNIQGLSIVRQAISVLYSSGRTTGTVVDSGYDITEISPIYDGTEMPYATQRLQLGGKDLTTFLAKSLRDKQMTFADNTKVLNEIKHKLCYMAEDFESEQIMFEEGSSKEQYTLPDGSKISLGSESFTVPEAILKPSLLGLDQVGLAELVTESVRRCDTERRKDMLGNIIMAGHNTMFRGFHNRMQQDIMNLSPSRGQVKVVCPPERNKSAWLGGSVIGSLSASYKNMITKLEYTDTGPGIVYSKC